MRWFVSLAAGVGLSALLTACQQPAPTGTPTPPPPTDVPQEESETGSAAAVDFSLTERYIDASVISGRAEGIGLIVVQNGEPIYEHYAGSMAPGKQIDATSGAKWLSAALIMTLVDAGEISLDDTVADYFPRQSRPASEITLRQLLNHTSGLPRSHECMGSDLLLLDQCANLILESRLQGSPGEFFIYGEASMQVAGAMAEVAAGEDWNTLFEQRLAEPLGMAQTRYTSQGNPVIGEGLSTTLEDYGRFLQMLLDEGQAGGEQVLSSEAVAQMHTIQNQQSIVVFSPHPIQQTPYGLGAWLQAGAPETGLASEINSPGSSGFFPMIETQRGLYLIFMAENTLPSERSALRSSIPVLVLAAIDGVDLEALPASSQQP